jgi:GNAT superfamily N-acetyltransferase
VARPPVRARRASSRPAARRATIDDLDLVVDTLVASHVDHAWEEWMLPGPDRAARLAPLVRLDLGLVAVPAGQVWMLDDGASVAVWQEPGTAEPAPDVLEQLDRAAVTALGRRREEIREVERLVHRMRPAGPHWYLATIGTVAARRRQGCGSAVLAPVLGRVDRLGATAYLETSAPENLRFYGRLGFEVVGHLDDLPHGAPDTWGMQRVPGAVAQATIDPFQPTRPGGPPT